MCEDDQHCTLIAWSKQPFFGLIHNGARLRHLARREVPVQVRARRLRLHEVVRSVVERTLLLDPIIFDMWIPGVLSLAPGQPCNSHHARHTGHSLMRFSPGPSCRGDAANPWLESVFITHVGCVSRHRFVCSQSIAIARVSCRVLSPLLEFLLLVFSEYHHCLSFRVLLRPAQHAHAVFARMSDHGPPNPQFLSTSIKKIDGSCSSSSDLRCAVAGRAFVTSVNTHPRGPPLRGFLSHHGTKTTWAMAFLWINCRTTTATVLTATATATLSLRACLFLCYTPITSPSAADFFYFLKPLGTD